MKKNALIGKLSEAVALEETTVIAELNRARSIVDGSSLDPAKKGQMSKKIDFLITDSAKHSKIIAGLIKRVNSSDETEF